MQDDNGRDDTVGVSCLLVEQVEFADRVMLCKARERSHRFIITIVVAILLCGGLHWRYRGFVALGGHTQIPDRPTWALPLGLPPQP